MLIAPAILHSQASEQMLAIARMGMLDKILGYLVTTDKMCISSGRGSPG